MGNARRYCGIVYFPMRSLELQDWPKDDPIYSSKGLFIHIPILENDEVGNLLDSQMDKDFYISIGTAD